MKKLVKSMQGVTLLEIMLVLAIAAMIIVMSVRYYQSANSSQQANSYVQQIQAVAAAADSYLQGAGTYASVQSNIASLLPSGTFNLPWGGTFSVSGTTTSYTVSANNQPPSATCALISAKLKQSNNYSVSDDCKEIKYTTNVTTE